MPPGHYGQQPPPYPQYPPPRRRSGTAGKTFGCLIVVLLIGGGIVFGIGTAAGWFSADDAASNSQAGDCMKAADNDAKSTKFSIVDCAAPDAAYKVAFKTDSRYGGCGGTSYMADSEKTSRRSGFTLCMTLNAKVGDCFNQTVGPPTGTARKVACGSGATYKVVKIVDKDDLYACGSDYKRPSGSSLTGKLIFSYPKPAMSICTNGA
ncbi:LppU/SCO3897 family protein [Virgisporangium aurantiacum]|uniref:Uncharacterized protein n=1 Tax=Virgisporangium aurantiacum TaxID=175570 RepID=A0A8J3ZJL4_9ACTN|nr:hypothetical protein [Virgisporangium aurantiacum]GIJ64966.1 hypothetical protein Vau01_124820 [Virgisporangium aurantiacum]